MSPIFLIFDLLFLFVPLVGFLIRFVFQLESISFLLIHLDYCLCLIPLTLVLPYNSYDVSIDLNLF